MNIVGLIIVCMAAWASISLATNGDEFNANEECRLRYGNTNLTVNTTGEDVPKNIKCLVECVFEKMGMIKEGKIMKDVVLSNIEKDAYSMSSANRRIDMQGWKKDAEKCLSDIGDLPKCEKGFQLYMCFIESMNDNTEEIE